MPDSDDLMTRLRRGYLDASNGISEPDTLLLSPQCFRDYWDHVFLMNVLMQPVVQGRPKESSEKLRFCNCTVHAMDTLRGDRFLFVHGGQSRAG